MGKIEALDPELAELIWQRFNFLWCKGILHETLLKEPRPSNLQGPHIMPHTQTPPHAPFWHWIQHAQQASRENGHERIKNLDGLAPEQYGSCKFKAADIQAPNTRLLHYLIIQHIIPEMSIFADLVSNYGLVVNSITSLSLQRVDVPKEPILCTFTTLQNNTH